MSTVNRKIYINTGAQTPRSAFVQTLYDMRPVPPQPVVFAEQILYTIQFVNGSGSLDERINGNPDHTIFMRLGPNNLALATASVAADSASFECLLDTKTGAIQQALGDEIYIQALIQVDGLETSTGQRRAYAQAPILIYNTLGVDELPPPPLQTYYTKDEADAKFIDITETASYANGAISASYALTASYCETGTGGSSDTASYVPFDGNRAIKRSPYTGLNVGGETITEFNNNLFFPFVGATININSTTLNYETGSILNVNITGALTPNDETIYGTGSVIVTNPYRVVATLTDTNPYSVTDSNAIITTTYRTDFQVNNDGSPKLISSANKLVNFNWPYLRGVSTASLQYPEEIYKFLTKDYSSTFVANKNYTYSGTGVYLYFCYPDSYYELVSIQDPNSFEVINSFDLTIKQVTNSSRTDSHNVWTNNYKVYKTKLLSSPSGIFRFYFTLPDIFAETTYYGD